jgi:hypothetical protein
MAGWDNPNVISGNKAPRIEELTQVLQFPPDEYVSLRLYGPLFSVVYIWFKLKTKEGKIVSIPKLCLDYDPIEQKFVRDICPYRASGKGRQAQVFYCNAIIRDIQENEPRKLPKHTKFESKTRSLVPGSKEKFFVKELNSKSYTPMRLVRLTSTTAESIVKLSKLNPHKIDGRKVYCNVADPKYGRDISILYNPNAQGTKMYDVQMGDKAPIKKSEMSYLMQPFFTKAIEPASPKEAEKDFKQLRKVLYDEDGESDDEDTNSKSEKKDNKNKNNKNRDKKKRNRDKDDNSRSASSSKKNRVKNKDKKSKNKDKSSKKKKKAVSWDDDEIPF